MENTVSREDLEKFDPSKLKPGATKMFEVINPQTHYHEIHYFSRDKDGELLAGVASNNNAALAEIKAWKKLKRTKPKNLKQLALLYPADLVPAAPEISKQERESE